MRKCFYGYSQNTTGPSYYPNSTLCNGYNDYNDHNDYNDFNDYNYYCDYRDSGLDLDLD